jgi:hypothetical protein
MKRVGVLLCASVLLTACGGIASDKGTVGGQTGGEALKSAPAGAKTTVAKVSIVKGAPRDQGSWKVTMGDYVEFHVTSDISETIHVHGLDVMSEIDKGSNTFAVKATAAGVYEVELEDSGLKIGDLSVYPK